MQLLHDNTFQLKVFCFFVPACTVFVSLADEVVTCETSKTKTGDAVSQKVFNKVFFSLMLEPGQVVQAPKPDDTTYDCKG